MPGEGGGGRGTCRGREGEEGERAGGGRGEAVVSSWALSGVRQGAGARLQSAGKAELWGGGWAGGSHQAIREFRAWDGVTGEVERRSLWTTGASACLSTGPSWLPRPRGAAGEERCQGESLRPGNGCLGGWMAGAAGLARRAAAVWAGWPPPKFILPASESVTLASSPQPSCRLTPLSPGVGRGEPLSLWKLTVDGSCMPTQHSCFCLEKVHTV